MWPHEIVLADDARWRPSELQDWYLERWREFWIDTAALAKKFGAKVVAISGGDERDGDHHGTKQLVSADEDDQDQAVIAAYQVVGEVADEEVYVRGTPSHGCGTEAYARYFAGKGRNVVPCGNHWSHWSYTAEYSGVKFDVAHAPGTRSGVPHTRGPTCARHSAYTREEYHQSDIRPPDLVIRHHIHYWQGPGCHMGTCCFFIPGWQAASNWVKSIGVKSATDSAFIAGGLRILCDNGSWVPYWWLRRPKSSVAWAQ